MDEKSSFDSSSQALKEHSSKDNSYPINDRPIKHYIKHIPISNITQKTSVGGERNNEIIKSENENLKKILDDMSKRYEKLKFESTLIVKEALSKLSTLDFVPMKSIDDSSFFENNKNIVLTKMSDLRLTSPSIVTKLKAVLKSLPIIGESIPSSTMSSPAAPGRPMKYPYTYTAKIAQFPMKFYIKNNWMWRYYFLAVGVTFPVFWKLGRMSNSPENVKKWEEIRKRDFGGHH